MICASLARSKYTIEGFRLLGQQLSAIARHAYFAKQMDAVEQVSQLMLALPLSDQLESVARYYQALCTWRRGDREAARRSLECVAEESPQQYRARALQIIGLTYHECGDVDAAFPFYVAAGRAAANCDLLAVAQSQEMIAVVRSTHGDHKQALTDLERLFPLVRAFGKYYPSSYYDLLNNLAVELGEVGRIAEAEAACAITLSSPLAAFHPNWAETRDEIAAKRKAASPSFVAIHQVPEAYRTHGAHHATQVDRAPEAHHATQVDRATEAALATQAESQRQPEPSRVLIFGRPAYNKDFFQRSIITIPARSTFNAMSILDRVLICVGPRAPPSLS